MTSLFDNVDIVKSSKNFWIPSEITLQHSIFDRKCQIYLLKDMNRCTYTFSNSVDVRRRVSQSLGEWLYIVHCHNCQLSDGQVSVWNGASVVLKFSLFDRNVQNKYKNSERNYVICLFNLKTNHSGRYNRLVTWMKRKNVIRTWRHWCAPGQWWWVSSILDASKFSQ